MTPVKIETLVDRIKIDGVITGVISTNVPNTVERR